MDSFILLHMRGGVVILINMAFRGLMGFIQCARVPFLEPDLELILMSLRSICNVL